MGNPLFFEDIGLEEDTQRRVSMMLAMNAQLILMAGVSISGMAINSEADNISEAKMKRIVAFHAQNVRADVWDHFLSEESPRPLFPGSLVGKERTFVSESMDSLIIGKTEPAALMAFGTAMFQRLPWVLQLLNRYTSFLEQTEDHETLTRTTELVQNVVDFLCGDRGVESLVLGEKWEDFRVKLRDKKVSEAQAEKFKALSASRTRRLEEAMIYSQSRPYPGSEGRVMDDAGVVRWSR